MRTRAIIISSVATVTAALALTACGSGKEAPAASSPPPGTATATTAVAAAASRPSPIATLDVRAGDLPSTYVSTDSEPVITPAFDAKVRRCLSLPAAPRPTESHQSGWNRDRQHHESAVLTTALRYADQDSANRYTGVADAKGATACFDKLLTNAFQGTGEDYFRIDPHSAAVRKRTSDEPSNVTAVVTYRLRTAPSTRIDPIYGRLDICYVTGPRLGAALTSFAFNEKPDTAVRTAALDRFAARIARG